MVDGYDGVMPRPSLPWRGKVDFDKNAYAFISKDG